MAARSGMGVLSPERYTLSGAWTPPIAVALVAARAPARRGLRVRRRGPDGARRLPAAAAAAKRRAGLDDRGAGGARSAACASRRVRARSRSSPAQARRDGLEDLDRSYPAAERHADEEVLKLLGLLQPSVDLRKVVGHRVRPGRRGLLRPAHQAPADRQGRPDHQPRPRRRSRSPTSSRTRSRTSASGSTSRTARAPTTRALARLALVEGSATAVMLHLRRAPLLRRGVARRDCSPRFGQDTGDLPPFVEAQLLFPYLGGQAFVAAALRDGRRQLDAASTPPSASARPPRPSRSCTRTSTSRSSSRCACAARRPRACWRGLAARVAAGTWGEWATARAARRAGGGRGLGRRPLRALAAARRRLPGAVPAARRARDALALGHAARRARVRDRAARVAARGSRGRARCSRAAATSRSPSRRRRARTPPGAGLACARGR